MAKLPHIQSQHLTWLLPLLIFFVGCSSEMGLEAGDTLEDQSQFLLQRTVDPYAVAKPISIKLYDETCTKEFTGRWGLPVMPGIPDLSGDLSIGGPAVRVCAKGSAPALDARGRTQRNFLTVVVHGINPAASVAYEEVVRAQEVSGDFEQRFYMSTYNVKNISAQIRHQVDVPW